MLGVVLQANTSPTHTLHPGSAKVPTRGQCTQWKRLIPFPYESWRFHAYYGDQASAADETAALPVVTAEVFGAYCRTGLGRGDDPCRKWYAESYDRCHAEEHGPRLTIKQYAGATVAARLCRRLPVADAVSAAHHSSTSCLDTTPSHTLACRCTRPGQGASTGEHRHRCSDTVWWGHSQRHPVNLQKKSVAETALRGIAAVRRPVPADRGFPAHGHPTVWPPRERTATRQRTAPPPWPILVGSVAWAPWKRFESDVRSARPRTLLLRPYYDA